MNLGPGDRMHHTPRLLLDHFRGSNGKLWQYDIVNNSWWETSARNVGFEYNMYPRTIDEKLKKEIESPVGEIFQRIRSGQAGLSSDERLMIALFISTQVFRTPNMRDNRLGWENSDPEFLAEIMQEISDFIESSEDSAALGLSAETRRYWDEWFQMSKDNPEELLRQRGWENPFELVLQEKLSPNFPAHDVAFFMQLAWRIIYADKERYLISDKPVEMWTVDLPDMGGTESSQFECVLPISKEVAIHLGRYGKSGFVYGPVVDDTAVRILNLRRASVANGYIYSCRKVEWIESADRRLENLHHLRFQGYPVIDVKFGQSFCPNCGKRFSQKEWAPLDAKFTRILELRGFPEHECLGLV